VTVLTALVVFLFLRGEGRGREQGAVLESPAC
jgi:hypothetical protein